MNDERNYVPKWINALYLIGLVLSFCSIINISSLDSPFILVVVFGGLPVWILSIFIMTSNVGENVDFPIMASICAITLLIISLGLILLGEQERGLGFLSLLLPNILVIKYSQNFNISRRVREVVERRKKEKEVREWEQKYQKGTMPKSKAPLEQRNREILALKVGEKVVGATRKGVDIGHFIGGSIIMIANGIIKAFVAIGHLIGNSITMTANGIARKYHRWSEQKKQKKEAINIYKTKLKQWEEEGYEVSELKELLKK